MSSNIFQPFSFISLSLLCLAAVSFFTHKIRGKENVSPTFCSSTSQKCLSRQTSWVSVRDLTCWSFSKFWTYPTLTFFHLFLTWNGSFSTDCIEIFINLCFCGFVGSKSHNYSLPSGQCGTGSSPTTTAPTTTSLVRLDLLETWGCGFAQIGFHWWLLSLLLSGFVLKLLLIWVSLIWGLGVLYLLWIWVLIFRGTANWNVVAWVL